MRRLILVFLPIAMVLAAAGVYLYRDPQVRGLFQPDLIPPGILRTKTVTKRPAPVRRSGRSSGAQKVPVRTYKPPNPAAEVAEEPEMEPEPVFQENRVPDPVLSRTLLRILMAKGLGDGISISVTDQRVSIAGIVESDEKRQQILEIVEKARENRGIDASHLILQPVPKSKPQ